jgi:hypothetical protein
MEGSRFIQIEASKWKQKVDHFFHFIRSPKNRPSGGAYRGPPYRGVLRKHACQRKFACAGAASVTSTGHRVVSITRGGSPG